MSNYRVDLDSIRLSLDPTRTHICSIFDAGIHLYKASFFGINHLANSDVLPITAGKGVASSLRRRGVA